MVGAHLELARGRALLDSTRAPDPLDGIFPQIGWLPVVPGASPERPLSASRWKTLLECPHRFFFEVLLHLRAPSEVQDDGALDPLTYGSLFHTVAERFYRAHGDAFVKRTKPLGEFEVDVRAIADEAMAESLEAYALAGEAVQAAQRERLLRDVRALLQLDWDLARDRVVAVERPFGTDAPLSISLERHDVYVRGYIDRIDIDAGVTVLRDLKTGKPKPRRGGEIDPSIDAQLALYALVAKAMREAWGLPKSMGVAYVYPAGVRHTDRSFLGTDYEMLEDTGRKWLEMTAELGASRAFPRTADTHDCSHCAFVPVCGPAAQPRAARVLASGGEGLVRFRTVRGQ
jgi:RecB family exonuclease